MLPPRFHPAGFIATLFNTIFIAVITLSIFISLYLSFFYNAISTKNKMKNFKFASFRFPFTESPFQRGEIFGRSFDMRRHLSDFSSF
jgi:hypothetical protein